MCVVLVCRDLYEIFLTSEDKRFPKFFLSTIFFTKTDLWKHI